MNTWRLRLRGTPWAATWRSDSLFGAICWRWLELYPETFEAMLRPFREGKAPPFVLSDECPGDLMPMPMHVAIPRAQEFEAANLSVTGFVHSCYVRRDGGEVS